MGQIFERYRRSELEFDEVQVLFSDAEESPLFRLKERCHTLFRSDSGTGRLTRHREVLFDVAVGSLFHEAMKFRESFYQREVYGPRVQALREDAGEEADAVFLEFEKILSTVSERLEEGLAETQELLARTREQLVVLVAEHRENGHLARFLIERSDEVAQVFVQELDDLLTTIYGKPAAAYSLAGRSYLHSGYYAEAESALRRAIESGGDREVLEPASVYARGMAAFLRGDYAVSVELLGRWADTEKRPEAAMSDLAAGAAAKIDQLAEGENREQVTDAAKALVGRLGELRSAPTS